MKSTQKDALLLQAYLFPICLQWINVFLSSCYPLCPLCPRRFWKFEKSSFDYSSDRVISPSSTALWLYTFVVLACVASISSRGSSRKLGQERKKKNERQGRGRGKKEPLARKPHDFEKLRSPTNAASDWRGAGSVDYLAFETSIKPGILCFRAPQIWSHLICGRRLQMLWTDIYLNRVCAKVYEIRVFKV